MIIYHKGSLFDAPEGSILAHACNCKGRWGSGIAKEFAKNFSEAETAYREDCREFGDTMIGQACLYSEKQYTVCALFTSRGYGPSLDSEDTILTATERAIRRLIHKAGDRPIHMNKINSGLFKVPWEKTAAVLDKFPETTFNVWVPDEEI